MEAFAVAANVMAVVSLTLQLAHSVENIKEFWKGVRDAPEEVKQILCDLDLLRGILDGLKRAIQLRCPNGPDPAAISSVLSAVQQCHRHIGEMIKFSKAMQKGFEKRSLVTGFNMTVKKPKIAEFSRHLEQAKTTLLLAINVASFMIEENCSERVLQEFSHLRSDIEMTFAMQAATLTLASKKTHFEPEWKEDAKNYKTTNTTCHQLSASDILLWLIQLPTHSPYRAYLQKTGRLVGRISWRSSKKQSWGTETLKRSQEITIHLPILRRSFSLQSQWALGQWTHTFRVTRIVPDTASIFRLCATKDEKFIRQILDAGLASPFDQTSSGITLLHVAAAGYKYETYKLLRECGVEYSLFEHPKYGKLAPVELTQDFTIYAEGTNQTVQQWLTISNDESAIMHPEDNYLNVVGIWNSSVETQESMTDDEIMTLLQGPLRLPRIQRNTSSTGDTQASGVGSAILSRCSGALLLFCYFYMFRQDPYGHNISKAWLHSSSLKDQVPVPLWEYLNQYWDGDKWHGMLSRCNNLDFVALAQRQQAKFSGLSYSKIWDFERGKRVRKRTARFEFGGDGDGEPGVWIGPLGDCEAVFEFETQNFEDDLQAENEESVILMPTDFLLSQVMSLTIAESGQNFSLFNSMEFLRALPPQNWVQGIIFGVIILYWLYL